MSAPTDGSRIGPYELLSPIGAGGMGEVRKARDTRVDRMVAVKFWQAQFGERLEREARPDNPRELPDIAVQVADGLAAAQITKSGRVKILDFGLAKQTETAAVADATRTFPITNPGTVLGTGAYMSPEQARAQLERIDAASGASTPMWDFPSGIRPAVLALDGDIWILDGFQPPQSFWQRLWPFKR